MQGKSLLPLFDDQDVDWRKSIYYHYYENHAVHHVKRHYGIRTDRYKLIHFYHDVDEWELYDLLTDPNELNNVYHDSSYFEIRGQLHHLLEEEMKAYGDSDELRDKILEEDQVLYTFPWRETREVDNNLY